MASDQLAGRKVGTDESVLAQDFIINHLKQANVKPLKEHYQHKFQYNKLLNKKFGNNIIGIIPGQLFPEKFIVISAHFDHIGKEYGKIFNGADDNASGTAALIDFAYKLQAHPLKYSFILLFTDGEENNLSGAKAFINDFPKIKRNTVLNINMDMIAGANNTRLLRYIEKGLDKIMPKDSLVNWRAQIANADVNIKKGFRLRDKFDSSRGRIKWETASDHGVYYEEKIPFIYFGVGPHRHYHKSSDTYNNVNKQFFIGAASSIFKLVLFIDQHI